MSVYPPTSYFIQGHIVAQPIAPPHGISLSTISDESSSSCIATSAIFKPMSQFHEFCWIILSWPNLFIGTGSNANVRPSLMDIQAYLPPGPLVLATRPDVADYSRPPPPGTNSGAGGSNLASGSASVSCFNCGASGHRGSQCKETPLEEIIKPSSLVWRVSWGAGRPVPKVIIHPPRPERDWGGQDFQSFLRFLVFFAWSL